MVRFEGLSTKPGLDILFCLCVAARVDVGAGVADEGVPEPKEPNVFVAVRGEYDLCVSIGVSIPGYT